MGLIMVLKPFLKIFGDWQNSVQGKLKQSIEKHSRRLLLSFFTNFIYELHVLEKQLFFLPLSSPSLILLVLIKS